MKSVMCIQAFMIPLFTDFQIIMKLLFDNLTLFYMGFLGVGNEWGEQNLLTPS